MSKYKAIIFDLDDTLILEKDYIKSGFKIIAKYLSFKFNDVEEKYYNKMIQLFNKGEKKVFNEVLTSFEIAYDEKFILKLIEKYRNHIPEIELLPDAKKILEYLKSKKYLLGIITDGHKETQLSKLKALNIEKFCDKIVVTDLLGIKYWKPHKLPYYLMKRGLRVSYKDMVYIGDNVTKDFVCAKKIGIKTVMIKRKEGIYCDISPQNLDYNAEIIIDDLDDLKRILED